jgi:hypothetical protein
MKKQDVVVAQTNEAVAYNANEWGDVVVEAKDLILPKILLQQALSEAVKSRNARDGDYLNTLKGTVCSNEKGIVSVLPFFCRQTYIIEKWNGKKFEFLKIVPNIVGEKKPFEETIEGTKYKNSHQYEFFCMLEDGGTPAIVSFRSTSHKTGKQLFNIMYLQNPQQNKTPAHNWINLGRKEQTNDMGTFWVMDISIGKESVKSEIDECLIWISTIKQSDFKVAEEKPETSTVTTETRF